MGSRQEKKFNSISRRDFVKNSSLAVGGGLIFSSLPMVGFGSNNKNNSLNKNIIINLVFVTQ